MNYSFLDTIGTGYDNEELDFLEGENIAPECSKFLEEHNMDGDTEDEFLNAVYMQASKSFKDGFKACIQMLLECASDKAVKS